MMWHITINDREVTNPIARASLLLTAHLAVAVLTIFAPFLMALAKVLPFMKRWIKLEVK
ncbi:MAG: hypothetical protein OEV86_13970 [Candidatus Krumholzibacteria bacterium]|nr:hypothetical protein [Candidatus Krumholzibacteria bacterium]